MTSPHKWLFVFFQRELTLSFSEPPKAGVFCLDGVEYRAPDENYLTAFYDRIVDPLERLIGIRIHPVAGLGAELLRMEVDAAYLHLGESFLDVFLTGSASPHAESAEDQAFGGQIFASSEGDLAVSIDLEHFCASPLDLDALRDARAHWVRLD